MTDGYQVRLPAAAGILATAALFVLGPRILDRAAPVIAGVRVAGQFVEHGDIPIDRGIAPDGKRPAGYAHREEPPDGGRFWSSWNGSNGFRGELVLGPFPAPRTLGLAVCGYPHGQGNRLYIENTVTSERMDVTEDNVGGAWSDMRLRLPPSWRNQPVVLHAVDGSEGFFGWLAVGEPRDVPILAAWWGSFARKLHGFAGAGLVLFMMQSAAMSLLRDRKEIAAAFLPLASFALVALAAYGVFWVFLADASAGKVLAWVLLAASAWILVRKNKDFSLPGPPDAKIPLYLMAAIGTLYVAVLFLYGSDRSLSDIAARRFVDNLAVDNQLTQIFADHLIHGQDPRRLIFGWSSGDRPPLQTACDLLIAYPVAATGVDSETAAQAAGIWMQLAWVCSAWGWLRAAGLSAQGSAMVIALIAPTGFLMLNTIYVWPKLLAGAFIVGAFAAWLSMRSGERDQPRDFVLLGVLGSLGFLANAGAAFSILAWMPLAAARFRLRRTFGWAVLAAVCAVLVLPWLAYQRFYDPPANLLLKWHLAGANLPADGAIPDGRGTWEAMRAAYRSHDLATLLQYRAADLAAIFRGPWLDRLFFRNGDLAAQRDGEYYGVFFALGRWNLGFVALVLLSLPAWRVRFDRETVSRLWVSMAWCLLTLVVWVSLMFAPGSTVIHQSSYACILMLLLCASLALRLAHPIAFLLVALANLVDFAQVWILPNPTRVSPLHPAAAVLSAICCAAIVVIVAATGVVKSGPTEAKNWSGRNP